MLTVSSIIKHSTSLISNTPMQKGTQKDEEPIYVVKLFTTFLSISKMTARASKSSTPSEYSPLLSADPEAAGYAHSIFPQNQHECHVANAPHSKPAFRLYISHFLSTWNSRVFEFGAVLYLASIYPGTLLPMSVYALSRGVAAILLAPAVGNYIDTGNRLQVVRVSIGV